MNNFSRLMYLHWRLLGIKGLIMGLIAKIYPKKSLFKVTVPGVKHPFWLRLLSSDLATYEDIYFSKEYDHDTEQIPEVIIDAGANIGLATILFSNKYPNAKIIAIEPEESNYCLLLQNTKPYENISTVRAALWNQGGLINIEDPGRGKWGFITTNESSNIAGTTYEHQKVKAITVDEIMLKYNIDNIDILKIDIEGAEKEVFECSSSWIGKTQSIIVELHERYKPGCNRSFYSATNEFDYEWQVGENIYLSRVHGLRKKSITKS